jgi:dolichol-phosphate mannosyltransferase
MDLSIIIPCFNEEQTVPALERKLFPVVAQLRQGQAVEVVFVDDGSQDDTARLLDDVAARHPEVRVVRHAYNKGLGAATRTGFAQARGRILFVTDSDGTYPFTEIPAMLALVTPDVDIVTASPYHPDGGVEGVPAYRIFLSKGASLLYRILLRWDVHTYTAMVRAYRREVAHRVPSVADGFLMPAEILSNAILLGYKAVEYPAVLHVRRYGQSKAKVARIILAHVRFQLELLFRRIVGIKPIQVGPE